MERLPHSLKKRVCVGVGVSVNVVCSAINKRVTDEILQRHQRLHKYSGD